MNSISRTAFIALILFFGYTQVNGQDDTTASAALATRALPSPMPSPPFPLSEWGGGIVIGSPNDNTYYPLQKLLGIANNKKRIKMYGWVDVGGDISSSKNSNAPTAYDLVPNSVQLDQIIFRVERQPNTVQVSHVDWGFLVDNIYGADFRYTIAKGIFSDQLLKRNNLYGYDPTQAYALLYIPNVAEGMLIKAGRFISPSDVEAQWAPDNYLYSHSLMFVVDPYTFTGVQATVRLSKYVQCELGLHTGNDVAPWSNSANLNGMAMVRWVSKNNNNSLYGGSTSFGKGYYTNKHDDLQMAVATWGHRFSRKVNMMTELYYMWQRNAEVGGTENDGPPKPYFMATGPGSVVNGVSSTIGSVNFFQVLLSRNSYLSFRNDFLNDMQGTRTGFTTIYTSHTLGFAHHFNNLITVRPEIRYETSYGNGVTPYDNGTRKDQYSAAADIIMRF